MKAIVLKHTITAAKRQRDKINVRWLYIWTAVLGISSIPWAAWVAYNWRGYKAIGGEVLLPILALMIVAFIRQVVDARKEIGK